MREDQNRAYLDPDKLTLDKLPYPNEESVSIHGVSSGINTCSDHPEQTKSYKVVETARDQNISNAIGLEILTTDGTELNTIGMPLVQASTIPKGNKKSNDVLRNKIFEQMYTLQKQVIEIDDQMTLQTTHEEIILLNNFLEYSQKVDDGLEMKIDSKMMKKQKTQRSWYK
jgi:hypothetical protein